MVQMNIYSIKPNKVCCYLVWDVAILCDLLWYAMKSSHIETFVEHEDSSDAQISNLLSWNMLVRTGHDWRLRRTSDPHELCWRITHIMQRSKAKIPYASSELGNLRARFCFSADCPPFWINSIVGTCCEGTAPGGRGGLGSILWDQSQPCRQM